LARLKKCYHYDQDETIQQIFILCPLARVVWRIVYMAFNISPPKILQIYLKSGLWKLKKKQKSELVFALYFGSFGMLRNDYIFNRAKIKLFYTGYTAGHSLDPYVVLPTTNGQA
jgi:hypothetical protein